MDDARTRVAKRAAWIAYETEGYSRDESDKFFDIEQHRWLALADAILPLLEIPEARQESLALAVIGRSNVLITPESWNRFLAARAEWGEEGK